MRTFNDMLEIVLQYFPNAEIGEDNDGQLVIYTDKTLEKDLVVDFQTE